MTQEKQLYTIKYGDISNIAEVSGKFRHEANSVSDYPAVGDYVTASWPTDGSHSIITGVYPRKSVFIGNKEYPEGVVWKKRAEN